MKEVHQQSYSHDDSDPLLWPYLQAGDEAQSQCALSEILMTHAEPRVNRVLYSSRFRDVYARASGGHIDDAKHDLYIQIIVRLKNLKAKIHPEPIINFRNYVVVSAVNFCKELLRKKYRQRRKLRNRVHYLLSTTDEFGLWGGHENRLLCGLAEWRGQEAIGSDGRHLELFVVLKKDLRLKDLLRKDNRGSSLRELLSLVFAHARGPITFKEVVDTVADLQGASEHTEHLESDLRHDLINRISYQQPDFVSSFELLEKLRCLWPEVSRLPPDQRAALLLGLRYDQNRSGLILLRLKEVATFGQIASALDMSKLELAVLWKDLPLSDSVIGKRLGLTQEQVKSSRMSARRRLVRRIKKLNV